MAGTERHIPCHWRATGIPLRTCRATQADKDVVKWCREAGCDLLGRLPTEVRPAVPEGLQPCACGCGELARKRSGSKYASDAYYNRVWAAANEDKVRPEAPAKVAVAKCASDSPAPRLCACGCGDLARKRSKYASPACYNRAYRAEHLEELRRKALEKYHANKAPAKVVVAKGAICYQEAVGAFQSSRLHAMPAAEPARRALGRD